MNSTRIHVAMCVDHGFTLPLAVALASIDHASKQDSVTVHVVHPGFSQAIKTRVTSRLTTVDVSWYAVDNTVLRGAHYSNFLSPASLYRLLLGELLPPELSRILYLDADTITLSSVASVYASELSGAVVGAVRDAGHPWAAVPFGPLWRPLGLSPASAYFNSGVLLIDLNSWRASSVGDKCLDLLRRTNLHFGDQDALNVILEGQWLELSRRWNLQTADVRGYSLAWAHWRQDVEDAIRDPSVIHFTERNKPWNAGSRHPLAEKWFEALDRTAWSGWRPRKAPEYPLTRRIIAVLRSIRDSRAQRRGRLPE